MRVSVIGSVKFTHTMIEKLIASEVTVASIITRKNGSAFHSDFADLTAFAFRNGIPAMAVTDVNDPATVKFIAALQPDLVFCLGWSQLISVSTIRALACPIIGYHPALLPRNRGRHPIIWALVLGLGETGSTFFRIEAGVDSGDIVSQRVVAIREEDDAATLYGKLSDVAGQQIVKICADAANGELRYRPQDPATGNVWRKRSPADGHIDWRMPSSGIRNLTRALRSPYPGATALYRGAECRVWSVRLGAATHSNIEPGRILSVCDAWLHLKCGDGTVYITEHDIPDPRAGQCLT